MVVQDELSAAKWGAGWGEVGGVSGADAGLGSGACVQGDADGRQCDLDDNLHPVDTAGVTDSQRLGYESCGQSGDDADEDRGDHGDVLVAAHEQAPQGADDDGADDGRIMVCPQRSCGRITWVFLTESLLPRGGRCGVAAVKLGLVDHR